MTENAKKVEANEFGVGEFLALLERMLSKGVLDRRAVDTGIAMMGILVGARAAGDFLRDHFHDDVSMNEQRLLEAIDRVWRNRVRYAYRSVVAVSGAVDARVEERLTQLAELMLGDHSG